MKKSKVLQTIIRNKATKTSAALTVFFMANPVYAQQLTTAKGALEKLRDDLKLLIPIAAAVILLCLAIAYEIGYIAKETFV